jgi:dienelactone hydrolase
MRLNTILLTLLALAAAPIAPAVAQGIFGTPTVQIPTPDGFSLTASVSVPIGPGPFPLLVMPSSWNSTYTEYEDIATNFANDGYVVVSYSSRGFGCGSLLSSADTCGLIDIAGPLTIGDVSTVITWALANTPANPNAIGVSGISYGSGMSLLGAENDPRIKAVASLSTWGDLIASLDAYQTPSQQGLLYLSVGSEESGNHPGPLMTQANDDVAVDNFDGAVQAILADPNTPGRSPITNVAKINANGPAVFIANAFEDSFFPPTQVVNFFNQLTVPKYLMLEHGDHTTDELLSEYGFSTDVYTAVTQWFDLQLKGVVDPCSSYCLNTALPVQMKSQTDVWAGYTNWNAVQAGAVTYNLTSPDFNLLTNPTSTGSLSTGNGGNWQYTMVGPLTETTANSGIILLSGIATQIDLPITTDLLLVPRANDTVWTGPTFTTTRYLTGMPNVQITVTPSTPDLTLYAYLYSVTPLTGTAQLMSWEPYTINGATPGVPQTINFQMEATDWEVDAGQQLALVIGSYDLRYYGVTTPGSAITLSSGPASAPSELTVSLH